MFGIPTLLNKPLKAAAISLIGNAAGGLLDVIFGVPKWGIYVAGTSNPGFYVSSIVELDASGESVVSDYPLENGSFTSYNKVVLPNTFAIRVTHDGNEALRSEFLQWLERNVDSMDTYDIVCPEHTWLNSTLLRYRIIRTAESGASMLTVDCHFQQIREKPAQYSSTTVESPEDQATSPTVQVNPIPDRSIETFPLPPLA